jgi:hypothetical protein
MTARALDECIVAPVGEQNAATSARTLAKSLKCPFSFHKI